MECAIISPEKVLSMVLVDPAGMERRKALLEFRLATLPIIGEMFTWPNKIGIAMLWRKAYFQPEGFVTEDLINAKVALGRQAGARKRHF